MAKCKIAPGKKKINKKENPVCSLLPDFCNQLLWSGVLSLHAKRGSGLCFCKGFLELLLNTTRCQVQLCRTSEC